MSVNISRRKAVLGSILGAIGLKAKPLSVPQGVPPVAPDWPFRPPALHNPNIANTTECYPCPAGYPWRPEDHAGSWVWNDDPPMVESFTDRPVQTENSLKKMNESD